MSTVAALKHQIAEIVAGAPLDAPGLPTGLAELDALLPGRGLPHGRLIEITGARGSGITTMLRRLVDTTALAGGWVAYIDATRTLAPRDWAHLAPVDPLTTDGRAGLCVIRPPDAARAAWCADIVLRAGTFALVVVDGAPTLPRRIAVRLTQLARESNAVLVVASHGAPATQMAAAVRLRIERRSSAARSRRSGSEAPDRHRSEPMRRRGAADRSTLVVTLEKGGTLHSLEVGRAIGMARRLCSHPEIPDRRAVARERRNARGAPGSTPRAADRPADGASARERPLDVRDGPGSRDIRPAVVTHRRSARCGEPPSLERPGRLESFSTRGRRTRVKG